MRLHFHEPPAAQKVGGLDAAIRSLQNAMVKLGHSVEVNPVAGKADAAHFHGMWQSGFPSLASEYRALDVPYIVSPHGMLEPWAWKAQTLEETPILASHRKAMDSPRFVHSRHGENRGRAATTLFPANTNRRSATRPHG